MHQLCAEEIEAIEKASEILSSDKVMRNAEKHLPSGVQKRGTSLTQPRFNTKNLPQQWVVEFLCEKGENLDSCVLFAFVVHGADDSFVEVKKMF